MPRVSLIVPTTPADVRAAEGLPAARRALEGAGHEVEIVVAHEGGSPPPDGVDQACALAVPSAYPGRAAAAMAGLERATGDVLILLDPGLGYDPDDLPGLVGPIVDEGARLVVARRLPGREGPVPRLIARLLRLATGVSDPTTGLIALSRTALREVADRLHPVGRQFSFEVLAKVDGPWVERPVTVSRAGRRPADRLGWDDLRHIKRLADHRFGDLARLVQYCVVGGSGMVVDLTCYFAFQAILGQTSLVHYVVPPTKVTVALALSRVMAIGVALVSNFFFNRRLTFSYARRGSIARQFLVYAASNALGVALSLALSLGLPRKVPFFNQHKLLAAVVGIVVATGVSFSMSRWVVFRRHPVEEAVDEPDEAVDGARPVLMERAG